MRKVKYFNFSEGLQTHVFRHLQTLDYMKILILGGTGRTGKLAVENALQRGHQVNALVRERNKLKTEHENLHFVVGEPTDESKLREAIEGCDAVLNFLNVSRKSDFPWSALRAPKDLISKTMKTVIAICEETNINRVVVCSAWGVAETKKDLPWWFRWVIDNSNIGAAYRDHERQEALLKESSLNWTSVRPVGLTNSTKKKRLTVSLDNNSKPDLTISRNEVAEFFLQTVEESSYIGQTPVISSR